MTVQATTRRVAYTADGVVDEFYYEFSVFAATDVQVYVSTDDGATFDLLTFESGYQTNVNVDQSVEPGGSIVFAVAPDVDTQIVITSDVPLTQLTEVLNLGAFFPRIIERALDKLTVMVQELFGKLGRTIMAPPSDPAFTVNLPSALERANLFLKFDSVGNPTVGIPNQVIIDIDGDGTDDGGLQGIIDALDAIAEQTADGNGYTLQLNGAFLLGDGLVVPATLRGLTITGGQLIADPASLDWTGNTPILELDGIRCKVIGTNFECSHVCSGIGDYGGRNTIRDCRILHFATFGVDLSGGVGDTKLISCAINQWLNGEADSDVDFTADGIKLTTQDVKIVGNTVSGNALNFWATGTAGSSLIRGNHFFNGTQFDPLDVVSITNANPGVVTVTAHGQANGQAVSFNVNGMTELDGNVYRVANVTANTFTLIDRDGVAINTTAYGVFTDGTVAPLRTNPKNIRCDYGAGGMQFLGNYFGNGEIDLYTDNVTIADTFGLNIDNNAYLSYLICLFGQPGVNHPSAFRMRNWRWSSAILNQGTVPQLITAPNDDLDEYTDDLTIFAPDGYDAWQFLAVGDRMTIGRPYEDLAPVLTIISPNDTGDGTMLGFANKGTTDLDDVPRLGAYGDRMQIDQTAASTTALRIASPGALSRIDFEDAGTAANPQIGSVGSELHMRGTAGVIFDEATGTTPTLATNGQFTFALTSNVNLRFAYRGSDGVTRVANITLA